MELDAGLSQPNQTKILLGGSKREDAAIKDPKLSRFYRIWTLCLLSFTSTLIGMHYSIAAPFFPLDAESKGASRKQIGAILGCDMAAMGVVSLIFPMLVKPKQIKLSYCIGTIAIGIGFAAFGEIGFMHGAGFLYVGSSCCVTTAIGASCALVYVTVIPLLTVAYPDKLSLVFAIYQVAYGLGQTAGPVIGALLYTLGGYPVPFLCLGVSIIICGCLSFTVHPCTATNKTQTTLRVAPNVVSFGWCLRIPDIWILALCQISTVWILGFSDSFMALFIDHQLGIKSDTKIALVFFVSSIGFMVSGLAVGFVCEWGYSGKFVYTTVALIPIILGLLYQPIIFESLRNFWWASFVQSLISAINAATTVPFFVLMKKSCLTRLRIESVVATMEQEKMIEVYVAGIFQLCRNIGRSFGTFICGGSSGNSELDHN